MKFWNILAMAAAAATLASPLYAQGPDGAMESDVTTEVVEEPDGTRTLVHSAVINAPVDAVWAALSTAEGWKMWGPRFAKFDLRTGGTIETAYHEGAKSGDAANIIHRILALAPRQMIALQVIKAPQGGPVDAALLSTMWGVYELEPLEGGSTRLTISGLGYGRDEPSTQLIEFFKSGNVYSINLLQRNLAAAAASQ